MFRLGLGYSAFGLGSANSWMQMMKTTMKEMTSTTIYVAVVTVVAIIVAVVAIIVVIRRLPKVALTIAESNQWVMNLISCQRKASSFTILSIFL